MCYILVREAFYYIVVWSCFHFKFMVLLVLQFCVLDYYPIQNPVEDFSFLPTIGKLKDAKSTS